MQNKQSETEFENSRLKETITLAEYQLEEARRFNEKNKEAILEAKKEMRENTPHSIGNLWGAEAFEALAALNQYANPINEKIESYEEIEKKISILERLLTNTARHCVIKRSIEFKNSEQFKRILDRFIEELPDRWIAFEDVYHGGECIIRKGLEFDAVLICDADNNNYHSEEDKNLLYIACTRALHRLNLFCIGEVSETI